MKIINFSTAKVLITQFTNKFNMLFLRTNFSLPLYAMWDSVITKLCFTPQYYSRNENMWNDGFLFDFLQKKTADAWVRRFVIFTGFLFSERVVFEFIVRIYLDNLIWVLHNKSIFESSNTSEMLTTTIFLLLSIFLTFVVIASYLLV